MGLRKSTPQLSALPLEAGKLHMGFGPERLPWEGPEAAGLHEMEARDEARNCRTGKPGEGESPEIHPPPPNLLRLRSLSKSTRHGRAMPTKRTTLYCL